MRLRKIALLQLMATAVLCAVPFGAGSAAAESVAATGTSKMRMWMSTPDGAAQLTEQPTRGVSSANSSQSGADVTLTVNTKERFQSFVGVGAAMTQSSADLISGLSPTSRDAVMTSLFDQDLGIGLSVLRQPIGSSEFVTDKHYTLNDIAPGTTDFAINQFNTGVEKNAIIPLLVTAKSLAPTLRIIASPWSAPAWMKTSGSLIGGTLINDERYYDAYVKYLIRFVKLYRANGLWVDYLTIQNEPAHNPPDYPGMVLTPTQQTQLIARLGPALKAAGLSTRILAWDHNWTSTSEPLMVLGSAAGRWVSGVAFHCYSGDPSMQLIPAAAGLAGSAPFLTECSGSYTAGDTADQIYRDTFAWHAGQLVIGSLRHGARTLITWNLALDPSGGPHRGGCSTCVGLLTISADGTVERNADYFTLGQVGKFVDAGATRVGVSGEAAGVESVAMANPDGSTAVIIYQGSTTTKNVQVVIGSERASVTLPAGALATVTLG